MKLYATTTSERASKGQGGNDYLQIRVVYGDKTYQSLATHVFLGFKPNKDLCLEITDELGQSIYSKVLVKGEKKKDEHDIDCTCNDCPHSNEWGKR